MSATDQITPEPRWLSIWMPWPSWAKAGGGVVLIIAAMATIITILNWADSRVVKCHTKQEIAKLLGPSVDSFSPEDRSWERLCDSWGHTSLRGAPTDSSRAELHEGSWFCFGYLVFYDGETIVSIYRLNTS